MAPPNPYIALFANRPRRRRFARAAPLAALRYSMGTARALARRGLEGRALTARLDVINAVGFRGGAGTAEAMQRDCGGRRQQGHYIDLLRALRAPPSRGGEQMLSKNNTRHLRQTIQALNAAAAEEKEELGEEDEGDNESSS